MGTKQLVSVIKIGGDIVDNPNLLHSFYENIKQISGPKIIIHGGGNKASTLQKALGIEPEKIEGRRITDASTLEVVTMVYAGLLNKTLVAGLQALGVQAIGLSGADGDAVRAHKREVVEIDYGFVGDIDTVQVSVFQELLVSGMTPVCCSITHDGKGQLLNTNADTLASRIAMAMSSVYNTQLFYCFTKAGVLENVNHPESLVQRLDKAQYLQMKQDHKIVDGMIPKLDTAFEALDNGVFSVHLGDVAILGDSTLKHTTLCL